MKDLYKIGEISKLYHIGSDSLRYYEELGILTPTRGENGYRLYRLNDLWRLNVIRDMRDLGFSMMQIKEYLTVRSVDSTEKILLDELHAINDKIKHYKDLRRNVETRIATLQQARQQKIGVVQRVILPTRSCYAIHSGYQTDEQMDMLMKQLLNRAPHDLYIIGNNRIGSVIPLSEIGNGNYCGYDSVFIIDKSGDEIIDGGIYLTIAYNGSSRNNEIYIPMLLEEARRQNLEPVGSVLELLWVDIHQSENPEEHVTELQMQCRLIT